MGSEESIEILIKEILERKEFLDKREKNPNPESFYKVGKGLGKYLRNNLPGLEEIFVSIGGDCRITTPKFQKEFIKGLTSQNISVLDFGYNRSTPSVEFGGREYGTHATVVVTASHQNPKFNGLKITIDKSNKLLKNINDLNKDDNIYHAQNAVHDLYIDSLINTVGSLEKVSIAVDCMNGAASGVFNYIAEKKGAKTSCLKYIQNGDFIECDENAPDPSKYKNLKKLQERVTKEKADLGIAFDGDADRLVAIEEGGKIIPPEYLGLVFAKYFADRGYKGQVILEEKLRFVDKSIKKKCLEPVYVDTGRPNIIRKKKEYGAEIAYELSGHIFIKDWLDDGMKNALLLLEIIKSEKKKSKTLSKLVDEACSDIPYNVGELRFDYNKNEAKEIIKDLGEKKKYKKEDCVGKGLRIGYNNNSIYFRTSSNEDKVSAVISGHDKNEVEDFLNKICSQISDKNFSDALLQCYKETAKAKQNLFYNPNQGGK